MGYSQAVAAAVVFGAVAVAAYHVTDTWADGQRELAQAARAAQDRDADARGTQVAITNVSQAGILVRVVARNSGTTSLDASQASLLFDGVPVLVDARTVDGQASDVWAPGQDLELLATASLPDAVLLVGPSGAVASWGA